MIDSHCHLTDPRLFNQLDDVLARAAAAGVDRMVTIGTTPEESRAAVEISRRYRNVRCTIGIHPNYVGEIDDDSLLEIAELIETSRDVMLAVGETGLDYFHKRASRDRQRRVFIAQLELAATHRLPVVIHSREAIADTLAVMADSEPVRAVFHCFTGTADEADAILAAGFCLGFTGPVTFKKNDELRRIATGVPLERLLIETDAPYLSPEPVRAAKTNEPSFVRHVLTCLALERGMYVHELDRITTATTLAFYNWPA